MLETRPFDPLNYIYTREEAVLYMQMALDSGEPNVVVDAVDIFARWLGRPEPHLPMEAGVHLVNGALGALGFKLALQPADETKAAAEAA